MKQLFLCSAAGDALFDVVKHIDQKPNQLKVGFINTSAEVYPPPHDWIEADKKAFLDLGFSLEEFSITNLSQQQIKEKLQDKQIIFIAGGNTFYLLDQVIKTGFDKILTSDFCQEKIYIGSSAGSMIIGKRIDLVSEIDEREKAPDLKSDGLEIVDYAILPHWGDESFRKEYKAGFDFMYTQGLKILPLADQQYLFVENDICQIIQVD